MKNMNIVLDILIPKSKFFFSLSLSLIFKYIDLSSNRQGAWTREDFRHFINALFSNKQRPYLILRDKIDEYFYDTDFNQDNKIDYNEFIQAWKRSIKLVKLFTPFFFFYYSFLYSFFFFVLK